MRQGNRGGMRATEKPLAEKNLPFVPDREICQHQKILAMCTEGTAAFDIR